MILIDLFQPSVEMKSFRCGPVPTPSAQHDVLELLFSVQEVGIITARRIHVSVSKATLNSIVPKQDGC